MPKGSKLDAIIMNPPYDKNLHLKFVDKAFGLLSDKGNLVYIGPDNWLINKYNFAQKSKIRNEAREKYSKYIDDIETFTPEEFNNLFGTSNWFGVSIFKMNNYAKGIDPSIYDSDNELLIKIINKIQKSFTSLRSNFTRRTSSNLFVPVRRTNHGYLNWVESDSSKNKAKDGILFNNKNEKINFIKSFDTWLYQYLNCTDWPGAENSADVPFLGDYTKQWTNEKLYKIFDIDLEEQKYIENLIKDKNPWNK